MSILQIFSGFDEGQEFSPFPILIFAQLFGGTFAERFTACLALVLAVAQAEREFSNG